MNSLSPEFLARLRFDAQQLATLRALGEYRGKQQLYVAQSAEVLGDLRRYQALGVTHVVFDPTRPDLRAILDTMARFADDVRPKLGRSRRP